MSLQTKGGNRRILKQSASEVTDYTSFSKRLTVANLELLLLHTNMGYQKRPWLNGDSGIRSMDLKG